MDYQEGKILEEVLTNQDKILKALAWIVQAMDENGMKPKEEKEEPKVVNDVN